MLDQGSAPSDDRDQGAAPAVRAHSLVLGYGEREAVRAIDLDVRRGEFLAVIGPSGSGKSTLMLAMNGGVPVRSGTLVVDGQEPSARHGAALERFRSRIGFVFQSFHLVGRLPVLHNVGSGLLARMPVVRAMLQWYTTEHYASILEFLRAVELEDRVLDRCDQLSGGQKQRVAIARALAQRPSLILADEPISALDPVSARRVMEILRRAAREYGLTVVCNLHQLDVAKAFADRVLALDDGRVVFDGPPEDLTESVVSRIYRGAPSPAEGLADIA